MSIQIKIVRLKFLLTSRKMALSIVHSEMEKTLAVAAELGVVSCRKNCKVPPMLGVDRDMRRWSLLQILQHNTIVNKQLYKVVEALGHGREFSSSFNSKTDTIPADIPNDDIGEAFRLSVEDFLQMVAGLPKLRGTKKYKHPIFGLLSAHGWLCMFGFHLSLHRKQAQKVASLLAESP